MTDNFVSESTINVKSCGIKKLVQTNLESFKKVSFY